MIAWFLMSLPLIAPDLIWELFLISTLAAVAVPAVATTSAMIEMTIEGVGRLICVANQPVQV